MEIVIRKKLLALQKYTAHRKSSYSLKGFHSQKAQDLENYTLFSGTYPYRPNKGVPPGLLRRTPLKLAETPSQCQQKASGNCYSAHVQGKEESTSKSNTGTFYAEGKTVIGLASSNRKPHIGRVNSQQALPCRHIHVLFEIWSSQHVCRNFVVSPLKRSFPVCCDKYVHEHFIPSFHSLHSLLSFHSRTFHSTLTVKPGQAFPSLTN